MYLCQGPQTHEKDVMDLYLIHLVAENRSVRLCRTNER